MRKCEVNNPNANAATNTQEKEKKKEDRKGYKVRTYVSRASSRGDDGLLVKGQRGGEGRVGCKGNSERRRTKDKEAFRLTLLQALPPLRINSL